jgi:hypothetical protein
VVAALLVALVGCKDDKKSTETDAGGSNAGTGGTAEAGKGGGGGEGGSGAQTLCDKYGGAKNIGDAITKKVIPKIAGDCRINAFFAQLPEEHFVRLQDCLSLQAEELFMCPGVKYEGSKASNQLPCRSMKVAHAGMGVGSGDFDALIEDVAAGLAEAGVDAKDIGAAAPALVGLKSDIVEKADAKTPTMAMCTADDGGTDGG